MLNDIKSLSNLPYSKTNFSTLKTELCNIANKQIELKNNLEILQKKLAWYEEQIKLAKQNQFGKKSETSEQLQLSLLFDATEEEPEIEPEEKETITYTRKKKTVGRKIDTTNLPRECCVHDLTDAEKQCACGCRLECIGEDISEQLEYKPAEVKVIEHVTPKYACRKCETIKTATKPETPIAKSMATASLLTEVIISKYEYHLPLYRRSKMFLQEGIDIPDNTLGNWVMKSGELLQPLGDALYEELNQVKVLQADETPVKVLDIDKKGYMWGYHSCDPGNRFIVFEYNEGRGAKVVDIRLDKYQGLFQTDGYQGYNGMRNKKGVTNFGCWAHCRRKFVDVVKTTKTAGKAHEAVGRIRKLYAVEDRAKDLSFAERKKLRQKESKPILDKFHEWLLRSLNQAPPDSSLGKALGYAVNQWKYLYEYINYGEVEIDNNLMENQIRPFAVGRRNWLFVGNQKGADIAALLYSLIQSCKMNNINARKYITYVLNQAGKLRRREVAAKSLLPQFIDKNLLE